MQHVPSGVKKPAQPNEVIGMKSAVRDVSDQCCERKFPGSKTAVEIGRACTSNHDGIKVSAVWLSEKRAGGDVNNRDKHRPNKIHQVDWRSNPNFHQGCQFHPPCEFTRVLDS